MDLIYPFLSVAGEAVGKTIDKFNYQKHKLLPNQLLFLIFSTMVTGLLVSLIFIHQPAPDFKWVAVGLVIVMVIISFAQNFFDYVGLHTKNLSLREPINNFEPILASFFAYIFFPSERDIKYIIAIFLSTFVLYTCNSSRKLKLNFDKGVVYLFLGVTCSALLASIYKFGLENISPFYLLLCRSAGVLILLNVFFRPRLKNMRRDQTILGISSGFMYIIANLSKLYSIKYLGLNFTIMVLILGPAMIYVGSALVLKEKVNLRQIVASIALLFIVVWAIYL